MTFFTDSYNKPFVWSSIFISVALVLGLWLVGNGIASRGGNTISTTGSAQVDVTADTAKWSVDIQRTAYVGGTQAAYNQVAADATIVERYFSGLSLASSSVLSSVIATDQNYSSDQNAPVTYNVHETVTLTTSDVQKIDELSHNIADLSGKVSGGTLISPQAPEYYVSTLPQLRVSLLGQAIKDAKARAEQIATSGGATVGKLQNASSGVVQVLAPNSTNVEDYGSYDTSTIQKQVMITAHATFLLN